MEVEKLRGEYEIEVDWQPFFLRPETPPEGSPLPEYIKQKVRDPNNPLKARAAREGLKMQFRDITPSTRRAHEAVEFAREKGKLAPLHASLLKRYWEESQDLYAMETLRGAAVDAGLDPDELQRAIERGDYRQRVEELVAQAQQMGVSAVPTFVLGDKFGIQGAQELPTFRHAMERLGAKPKPKAP